MVKITTIAARSRLVGGFGSGTTLTPPGIPPLAVEWRRMTPRHIFALAISIWGCVVIYGTHRRWRFIVDPPNNRWFWRLQFHSVHRMKRDYGTKGVVVFMYII